MNRSICTILLVSLIATVCEAGSNAPGSNVRIPRAGIDALLDSVAAESEPYASKMPLPDVSSTISGVAIDTKNVRVGTLERPKVTYKLQNPNTLLAKVDLSRIVVKGAAHAERRTFVTTQKDAGEFEFAFTGTVVELSVAVRKLENGVLTVSVGDCKPSFGPGNLNVKGFREKFAIDSMTMHAKAMRTMVLSQVCPMIEKMLTTPANRALAEFPIVFEFSKDQPVSGQITLALMQDYLQLTLPPSPGAPPAP